MSWLRFWKRDEEDTAEQSSDTTTLVAERSLPPHLAAGGRRTQENSAAAERRAGRRSELERRWQGALFDIEQGELALTADNPWQERIALLTEAMETVEDDLRRLDAAPPEQYAPLPETPITNIEVSDDQPPEISFTIGDTNFHYAEEIDWAERGHQIARGELRRLEGDPALLLPPTTAAPLRGPLIAHLTDSLFVFATDLRDRAQDGERLPEQPALADLGRPCPRCGGWLDWRGRCQACARRDAERLQLKRESGRLLDERSSEAEEQHRLAERLPVARRRLADINVELDALNTSAAST